MAVTIKDVALRAGVSIASVSRALHGTGVVTDQTRLRVVTAARELRYTPHETARSLIRRRTNTVGVLLPDIFGEYFSDLIQSVDHAARKRGLHLLVTGSRGDNEELARALRSMSGRVDGVLIMSPFADVGILDGSLPDSMPAVLMNTPNEGGRRPAIFIDNFGGAREMVQHLLRLGHQRIAHICGPGNNYEANERLRGFKAAMSASPAGDSEVIAGDFTEECGFRIGKALAKRGQLPDAVFAANDMMAIGCLLALRECGLRVPEDMAIAGFDDIPVARYLTPPLTTVRTQAAAVGMQALAVLAEVIEGKTPDSNRESVLAAKIVVRASCGEQSATVAP